ncbi:hypothetical protein LSH36_121g12004 [Paralvinella palmiformis]|uniref:Uncharacterized protein n=1 Tax=Paralvinella palmiformis TaxID=53620 RepID=A0AAD9JY93_9ANNE|nr:hypothetical protein LSH36_121g12004 [Paralvinella palmiformis]
MVTAKQRQEFRIKLQKRARRRAEKKIESLEEEKHFKEKEISNLQSLCEDKGATEQEIGFCKPRKRNMAQKNTSAGLSSIASLSLGFTMSMHMSGGSSFMNNAAPGALENRRLSSMGPDAFPGLPMLMGGPCPTGRGTRRTSVSAKTPADSVGAKVTGRTSMERVVEETNGDGNATSTPTTGSDVIQREVVEEVMTTEMMTVEEGDEVQPETDSAESVDDDVTSLVSACHVTQTPEPNGDAPHLRTDDVKRPSCDTSSNPDISNGTANGTSRDPANGEYGGKPAVPPRAAVVAMEIPNGPVAIATGTGVEGCPLETNADHITWYNRPTPDAEGDRDSTCSEPSELASEQQQQHVDVTSPSTSLASGSNHSASPTKMTEDRCTPSPNSSSS